MILLAVTLWRWNPAPKIITRERSHLQHLVDRSLSGTTLGKGQVWKPNGDYGTYISKTFDSNRPYMITVYSLRLDPRAKQYTFFFICIAEMAHSHIHMHIIPELVFGLSRLHISYNEEQEEDEDSYYLFRDCLERLDLRIGGSHQLWLTFLIATKINSRQRHKPNHPMLQPCSLIWLLLPWILSRPGRTGHIIIVTTRSTHNANLPIIHGGGGGGGGSSKRNVIVLYARCGIWETDVQRRLHWKICRHRVPDKKKLILKLYAWV